LDECDLPNALETVGFAGSAREQCV
jgi:hypothetical protein